MKILDALVNSIAGAETWEWQNKARLDKIKTIREIDIVSRQRNSELYVY